MTPISQMTDDELNWAIAEESGLTPCEHYQNTSLHGRNGQSYYYCSRCEKGRPYYTGDVAAAMGLVPKHMDFTLSWDCFEKKWGATIGRVSSGDCDNPARAISEAWLTQRRNDG